MKKRILIFAVVASMLMTMLALPTFATENSLVDDLMGDTYYEAVVEVGSPVTIPDDDLSDALETLFSLSAVASDGSEYVVDSFWQECFNTQFLFVVYDNETLQFTFGADDDGFLLSVQNGVVTSIRGQNNSNEYASLTVRFNGVYYPDSDYSGTVEGLGGPAYSSEEDVNTFVNGLKDVGIAVEYKVDSSPSGLVPSLFEGFGATIGGIAGGLKAVFNGIVYVDGASGTFSPLVIFIFVMGGLGLATAILYKIFGMVRRRKG